MQITLEVADKFAITPKILQEEAKKEGVKAIEASIDAKNGNEADLQKILDFKGFAGSNPKNSTDIIREERELIDGRNLK